MNRTLMRSGFPPGPDRFGLLAGKLSTVRVEHLHLSKIKFLARGAGVIAARLTRFSEVAAVVLLLSGHDDHQNFS